MQPRFVARVASSTSEPVRASPLLAATRAATRFLPGFPVVTYGTGSYAAAATHAGFVSVGELRVWGNSLS